MISIKKVDKVDYDNAPEYFEILSNWYDAEIYNERIKNILGPLGKIEGKILDVGTGIGTFSIELARRSHNNIVAFDFSSTALKYAITNAESYKVSDKIHFVQGTVEALPFHSDYFDVIVAADIIEHIYSSKLFLKEIHRVLKKAGKVVFETPNMDCFGVLGYPILKKTINKLFRLSDSRNIAPIDPKYVEKYHVNNYTIKRLAREVEESGLKVTYIDTKGWWLELRGFDKITNIIFEMPLFKNIFLRYKNTDIILVAEKR